MKKAFSNYNGVPFKLHCKMTTVGVGIKMNDNEAEDQCKEAECTRVVAFIESTSTA